MAAEKQPTEAQWRLIFQAMLKIGAPVAGAKPWETLSFDSYPTAITYDHSPATGSDWRIFRPLHDYNDLAQLIEAMQKAGYHISRWAWGHDNPEHETTIHRRGIDVVLAHVRAPTDIEATFWAIVGAMEREASND